MPKGKKTCPKCGLETGPRTYVCPQCGHEYKKQGKPDSKPEKPKAEVKPKPISRNVIVDTPRGKCPFKLESPSREDVVWWAARIVEHGESINRKYSATALRYWASHFFERGTKEFQEVCEVLTPKE